MEFIIIDGRRMTSIETAHEYLAKTLRLPDYYGKNLDALHDCLTDLSRSVWIVLINGDFMDEQLGDYAKKLRCANHGTDIDSKKEEKQLLTD